MKITDFDIKINKENVLRLIDCHPDSPVYDAVLKEYEEVFEKACKMLFPAAVLVFGDLAECGMSGYAGENTEGLFCMETVGGEISCFVSELFEQGFYVKGMIADAIADEYMFRMDEQIQKLVVKLCREKNYGVLKRLEAPRDIPMKAQRIAWKVTHAREELGMEMKESYMMEPVKSNCQIYILKEGCTSYNTAHDCGKCDRVECSMRKQSLYPITVEQNGKSFSLEGIRGKTLLETLQNAEVCIPAVCGGKGTCGKCKVRFKKGKTVPTKEEAHFFSKQELDMGYRLACKAVPEQACVVSLEDEEHFLVVSEHEIKEKVREKNASQKEKILRDVHYGVAVDIGTTTIAMQLVGLESRSILDTYVTVNHQRAYGADIISRISASNAGKRKALQQSILGDLRKGIDTLLYGKNISAEKMVISGNTTMIHLLMGYSCETLGVYPFTPVNVDVIESDYPKIFGDEAYTFSIVILPGASAYVGGDITAGLLTCGFYENEKVSMLIDLGTNGEMAIGCRNKILVTSTAVGPAFEGGNITCGMGSIQGAISSAKLENGKFQVKTIGGKEPIGICGTGVIDIVYELLASGAVDKTGLLEDEYLESGVLIAPKAENDVRFYQKDIREFQLAKAAVRAGVETLIAEYGISYGEIDAVYIAGGFGYKLDTVKAAGVGLFPEEFKYKMKAIGNSSLEGSVLYLTDAEVKGKSSVIISKAEEIQLASHPKFHDFYMNYMYF